MSRCFLVPESVSKRNSVPTKRTDSKHSRPLLQKLSHLFLERVGRSVEITVKLAFFSTRNAVINNAITIHKKESRIISTIYK